MLLTMSCAWSVWLIHVCVNRWLLGYPAVYLATEDNVNAAATALSADDRLLVQLHVPALVRGQVLHCCFSAWLARLRSKDKGSALYAGLHVEQVLARCENAAMADCRFRARTAPQRIPSWPSRCLQACTHGKVRLSSKQARNMIYVAERSRNSVLMLLSEHSLLHPVRRPGELESPEGHGAAARAAGCLG